MHDLIHDLAQDVSEGEYFRIESEDKKEIPVHTRHIYVDNHMLGDYVEKICKIKDLRTIISFKSYSHFSLKEVNLDALFKKLRKLYVVEINRIDVKRVHKSVAQLRNLRYLQLFGVVEKDALSGSLNKLYQLRFLYTSSEIHDIGRLISLQELNDFHVGMGSGFELKQLEHLRDLYGSLSIYGLSNVKSKEDAYQAKLSVKKGLHKLQFCWGYESRDVLRDIDVKIIDGVCPPPQIKELTIEGYSGKRFPSWIDNIIQLQDLKLANCRGLEALYRINELSDLLSLTISFLPRLKSWVPLPSNLTQLEIHYCFSLAFAVKEDLDMIMSTKGTRISRIVPCKEMINVDRYHDKCTYLFFDFQFKHVQEMMKLGGHIEEDALSTISKDLKKCLGKRLDFICKIKDVYGELFLPPSLKRLSIESCFITDKILARSLQGVTSLTFLWLVDIITITCISKELISSLTNLLYLYIEGCLFLTSIGGLYTHSTLEEFTITCCPNLSTLETSILVASNSDTVELTSLSHRRNTRSSILKNVSLKAGCMLSDDMLHGLISVEKLCVWDCPTMVNPHIGHLKALSVLELHNCPNLASLKGLSELNYLRRLEVYKCDKLECYLDADKLPQLKELCINRFSLLEQLVSRDGFSSLFFLELTDAQQEYFSQEECELFRSLSSLIKISFGHCQMRTLPSLMCLHSLEFLDIVECRNLHSLQDFPPSVHQIEIHLCDKEFTRSCEDPNHPNGHKISHIPHKIFL